MEKLPRMLVWVGFALAAMGLLLGLWASSDIPTTLKIAGTGGIIMFVGLLSVLISDFLAI